MSAARDIAQPVAPGYAPYVGRRGRRGRRAPRRAARGRPEVRPEHAGAPRACRRCPRREHGPPQRVPRWDVPRAAEAAASYVGLAPTTSSSARGRTTSSSCSPMCSSARDVAAVDAPTYALYRIATTLAGSRRRRRGRGGRRPLGLQPEQPDGELGRARGDRRAGARAPRAIVVADEAYVEYGARSCALGRRAANLVVLRTLSKAFGFASLRVGYALAHPETASLLTERRAPAPISGPAAAIASAALRNPRLGDVDATVVERERVRASLADAGYDVEPTATNFVYLRTSEPLAETLERQGWSCARSRRHPDQHPPTERERRPPARARRRARRRGGREATVLRTTTETALRLTLSLDGSGRTRVETGIGFVDHLLTLLAFHADSTSSSPQRRPRRGRAPHRRGRPRRARVGARAGARVARGRRPLRLGGWCRWTRRAQPPPSTSCGGRTPRSGSRSRATAWARSRSRCSPTRSSDSRSSPGARFTSRRREATTTTSPRRRTRRSARRCGRRWPSGGDPLDEGRGVKVAIADYGAGNLRSPLVGARARGRRPRRHDRRGDGARRRRWP